MQYSLCIATDFERSKVNLQFFYDSPPSIAQVLTRAYSAFNQLNISRGISHQFIATTVVIFNENNQTWDRLERSSQLVHNGQIYLFQPDVVDIPAEIPDPISAEEFLKGYVSPHASRNDSRYSESPMAAHPLVYEPRDTFSRPSPLYNHTLHVEYHSDQKRDIPTYTHQASPPYRTNEKYSYNEGRSHSSTGINRGTSQFRSESREYPEIRGPSIIQDEREQLAKQSNLTLDEYRAFVRKEAKEYSPERVC
eukprot:Tbor_TRINITY_DN4953_c2_g2::TRINITY_DN4953_c2_g2_i1::g.9780::m.9780